MAKINFKSGSHSTLIENLGSITEGDICFGTFDDKKGCILAIKTDGNFYKVTPEFSADTEINFPLVGQGTQKSPIYSGNIDLLSLDVFGRTGDDNTGIIKIYGGYATNSEDGKQVEAIRLYGANTSSTGPKEAKIIIGNNKAGGATGTDNRYGSLQIYSQNIGSNILKARTNLDKEITFWLPQSGGTDNGAYAVWADRANGIMQVGDSNHPVYIDNEGMVVACSSVLGNETAPFSHIHARNFEIYGVYSGITPIKTFVAGSLTGGYSSTAPIAAMLTLGNEDTDNTTNRYGAVKLFARDNHFAIIQAAITPSTHVYFTLPPTGNNEGTAENPKYVTYAAWIPKNNDKLTVGSTGQPVWVDETGQLVTINSLSTLYGGTGLTQSTTVFNKLYYYTKTSDSDLTPKWVNGNHYIDNDKVGINGDFSEADDGYNFYVNGSALFNQNFKIESALTSDYTIDFISSKINAKAKHLQFTAQGTKNSEGVVWIANYENNAGWFTISPNSIYFDYYTDSNYYLSSITPYGVETWGQQNDNDTITDVLMDTSSWSMWSSNGSNYAWVDLTIGTGDNKGLSYNYFSPDGLSSSLIFDENLTLITDSTINMTGNTTITGELTVSSATKLNNTLTVAGTSTFNDRAYFKKHIQLVPTTHSVRTDMDYFDIAYTSYDSSNNSVSWYTPLTVFSFRPSSTTEIKGACMKIGAGGPTIVGGGESADSYINTLKYKADATGWTFPNIGEEIYVTSDYAINLISQCGSTTKVTVDGKTNSSVITDGTMRTVQIYNGSICVEENWGFGTVAPDASTSNVKTGAKVGQVYFKIIS